MWPEMYTDESVRSADAAQDHCDRLNMYFNDVAILQHIVPLDHLPVEYRASPHLCELEPGYEILMDFFGKVFERALFGKHEGRRSDRAPCRVISCRRG